MPMAKNDMPSPSHFADKIERKINDLVIKTETNYGEIHGKNIKS